MNERTDGQTDERIDRWMDGRTVDRMMDRRRWTDRLVNSRQVEEQTDGQEDGHTDGQEDGQTGGWTDRRMGRQMDRRMGRQTD